MKNKKQDEKPLEKLVKTADSYRAFFSNLANELSKVLADVKAPYEEEDTWEMKCPYEHGDTHYCIQSNGAVFADCWDGIESDNRYFSQGNVFPTLEEAELEAERRNLLTRFRAFRDECNDGWKPDWNDNNSKKWVITKNEEGIYAMWTIGLNDFSYFGCFKNQAYCERAIELFGDEIKALFVDCEAQ